MKVKISELKLTNFRNFSSKNFTFDSDIIAIHGNNGVGKTNILESITLLSKTKGLRSADLDDMVNNISNFNDFTIYSCLNHHPKIQNIGTSYDKIEKKRVFKVNSENIRIYPTIIWLTPQMDNIFSVTKNVRRKFLDKIVADIDPYHKTRINSYDKALRERINILESYQDISNYGMQDKWLDVIEKKIAELGSAIAISRNEAIEYLNKAILLSKSDFIKTQIKIIGDLEGLALENKAIFVENEFLKKLKENRGLDAKIGRTIFGIHRSDFTAILLDKNLEAKFCSTGEQKSILIAITFARVRILSFLGVPSAILLLDEIVSHLDNNRKQELFKELQDIDAQSFLTGVSYEIFEDLKVFGTKKVQFLEVK